METFSLSLRTWSLIFAQPSFPSSPDITGGGGVGGLPAFGWVRVLKSTSSFPKSLQKIIRTLKIVISTSQSINFQITTYSSNFSSLDFFVADESEESEFDERFELTGGMTRRSKSSSVIIRTEYKNFGLQFREKFLDFLIRKKKTVCFFGTRSVSPCFSLCLAEHAFVTQRRDVSGTVVLDPVLFSNQIIFSNHTHLKTYVNVFSR